MHDAGAAGALGDLSRFREEFYRCLTARADALFELSDAVLCSGGPVTSLVELSLTAEHRRGHGALYDGVNQGRIDIGRFRNVVARQSIPRGDDGRITLAVDVSHWLRPDANISPERLFCHTYARGKGHAQMIPGWPYSFVVALEPGRTSWTAILDAQRLGPDDEDTAIAAAQLRTVVEGLIAAGHWREGDPQIWIVGDTGYDGPRLAFLLADLPVTVLVRLRSDRVMAFPAPPRAAGTLGRPQRHGPEFAFTDPRSWPEPDQATTTETSRYGTAVARSWDRLHPRLTHRGVWADHEGDVPVMEGTVIRLQVEHLPGDGAPKPLWLWYSGIDADATTTDQLWRMFLRRFDLEHTFRFLKQTLGWTRPRLRDPQAADRWTWLIIAAYTQLRLARHLVEDLRRPWERAPARPGRLTPARVRRGFRNIRPATSSPASAPKPTRPGPGRPPGSRNTHRAVVCHVGKNPKTDTRATNATNQTG
ncbi:NF041680 family putative transposase [Amycolatopsis sp. H20-H5]|uniref:NF041680 family putative transposase n=1 Tax=Amycolatopsis sp. H20-H5 TaxID=3046309 RepID=UPI002DBC43D7|nr:NF041680 family putative transposase [Amycolatopsis sp. H20-H5]MEC3982853.1 NF041680 family putative transposase [Amycolatopsis sp. H20-H5]